MTDERQPGAQEDDRAVDGPAALDEVFHLQEQLAARGGQVRQDAERALGRAAALRADGDPRAGIAVSACRETLGAYQEAVDRSVRQACDAAGSAAAIRATSPARSSARSVVGAAALGPAPSTGTAIRHKAARLLAAAAVTGVLGLVGWGGLPSWSTVTATSPGQPAQPLGPVVADAPATPDAPDAPDAPELSVGAGRAPRPEGRGGLVEHSAGQPAPADRQHDDVRGVIASTLPGPVELSPSVAIVANGLRAVGEAAASVATAGETLSSDGPSDDDAADAARSLLTDGVDSVDEAVDAAGDGAGGVDDLEDGELPDTRSPEEAGDADGLDAVTEDRELWDGDEDGDEAGGEPEDSAAADGVSEGAELDH